MSEKGRREEDFKATNYSRLGRESEAFSEGSNRVVASNNCFYICPKANNFSKENLIHPFHCGTSDQYSLLKIFSVINRGVTKMFWKGVSQLLDCIEMDKITLILWQEKIDKFDDTWKKFYLDLELLSPTATLHSDYNKWWNNYSMFLFKLIILCNL